MPMDRGPWTVEGAGRYIYSDDFKRDVRLMVSGDFDGDEDRIAYSEWLASVLNAAAKVEER